MLAAKLHDCLSAKAEGIRLPETLTRGVLPLGIHVAGVDDIRVSQVLQSITIPARFVPSNEPQIWVKVG